MEDGIQVFLYNGETIVGNVTKEKINGKIGVQNPVKVNFSLKLGSSDTGNSDSAIISWELTPFFYNSLFKKSTSNGSATNPIFYFPEEIII